MIKLAIILMIVLTIFLGEMGFNRIGFIMTIICTVAIFGYIILKLLGKVK